MLPFAGPRTICVRYLAMNEQNLFVVIGIFSGQYNISSDISALSNCVKTVCPCKEKACGDTCEPARPSPGYSGPYKCQPSATGRANLLCQPAASVKCAGPSVASCCCPVLFPIGLSKLFFWGDGEGCALHVCGFKSEGFTNGIFGLTFGVHDAYESVTNP